MTNPTLTHGHGFLTDCESTTGYVETADFPAACTLTSQEQDFFDISIQLCAAGDEEAFYSYPDEGGASNLSLSSTLYTKAIIRWKTSATVNGAGARVILVFSDASTQDLLEPTGIPQFSTSWVTTTTTITASKVIDHVRFEADDYPNNIAAGTFHVYFDFLMLCRGVFTLPYVSDSEAVELDNNISYLKIPARVGNKTQYMGADSPTITVSGDIDTNTNWGSPLGQYLIDIWKNSHAEDFQWFASDLINCKVTMPKLKLSKKAGSKVQRLFEIQLRKYDRSSGDSSYVSGLEWLGL